MSLFSLPFRAPSHRKRRRAMRGSSPSRSLSARVGLSVERLEDRTLLTASWLGNLAGPDGLQALLAPAIEPNGNPAVVWDGAVHHAVAGQWVARFSGVSGTPDDQMRTIQRELTSSLPADLNATVVKQLGLDGQVLIQVSTSVAEYQVKSLADFSNVLYVEPNIAELSVALIPNDPDFSRLYGMQNISAPNAWDLTTGSSSFVLADIDTGVDYTHPDLRNNVWLNNAEIPDSRLQNLKRYVSNPSNPDDTTKPISFADLNDSRNWGSFKIMPHDDGTGNMVVDANDVLANMDRDGGGNDLGTGGWAFPGNTKDGDTAHANDYVGWNFVNGTNRPLDDNHHGTHTAGTIGAEGNNSIGVVGVNWVTQIMPVKFLDSGGNGTFAGGAAAVNYSVRHGANVSNNSWGAAAAFQALYDAVKNARDHGDLFVAAAGNFGQNNDVTNFTPAIYTRNSSAGPALDNVIAVAATDNQDGLAGFSNYGPHSVQLGAPGVDIWSTFPVNRGSYAYDSGTSMAAPHVAGAAALLWGFRPDLTYLDIKNALLNGVDPIASLNGKTTTGGRLDVFKSLELVVLPAGPTVVGSAPTGSTLAPINSIRFTFDTAINPDTFTRDQVRTFTGPGGVDLLNTVAAVTPVSGSNGIQFDVSFTMPLDSQGDYSMQIGPHILDTADRPMDQNRNGIAGEDPGDRYTATFSLVGPIVASASPSGFVLPPVDHVRVTFNEPMDPATFTPNQVSFTGPGGAIVVAGVTPVDGSNNTQFDVGFDTQTALGAYTMVIGPGIMDPLGNSAPQFTDQFTLSPIPLNGGFEAGDFTGWTTIGSTAIKTASLGTGPTEGTFDALITNDSGPDHTTVESFLGLDANALTSLVSTLVSNVTNGSAIQQTINVSAGSTLTFDWNFLTNEAVGATLYRDFGFLSITPVGAGGTLVKLADTTSPLVVAPSATAFFYMTGFSTFTFTFTMDGTYILGVGAMNAGDQNINSALLVDNFQITPPPPPSPTPPPRFARALAVGGPGAAPIYAAFAPITAELGFAGADTAGAESVQPPSDHNDLVFSPNQGKRRRVAISTFRGQGQPHGSDAFDPFAGPAGADSWWWV